MFNVDKKHPKASSSAVVMMAIDYWLAYTAILAGTYNNIQTIKAKSSIGDNLGQNIVKPRVTGERAVLLQTLLILVIHSTLMARALDRQYQERQAQALEKQFHVLQRMLVTYALELQINFTANIHPSFFSFL